MAKFIVTVKKIIWFYLCRYLEEPIADHAQFGLGIDRSLGSVRDQLFYRQVWHGLSKILLHFCLNFFGEHDLCLGGNLVISFAFPFIEKKPLTWKNSIRDLPLQHFIPSVTINHELQNFRPKPLGWHKAMGSSTNACTYAYIHVKSMNVFWIFSKEYSWYFITESPHNVTVLYTTVLQYITTLHYTTQQITLDYTTRQMSPIWTLLRQRHLREKKIAYEFHMWSELRQISPIWTLVDGQISLSNICRPIDMDNVPHPEHWETPH